MRTIIITLLLTVSALQPVWAQDKFKIGLATTDSGTAEFYGEQERHAAFDAEKWINDNGGILGRSVEIMPVDDHCDPAGAANAAGQLISEGVHAVLGHVCGPAAAAAAPVYAGAKVPFLTLSDLPALTEPEQRAQGTFRLCGRYDTQARRVADYLSDTHGTKRIGGVFFESEIHGRDVQNVVENEISLDFSKTISHVEIVDIGMLVNEFADRELGAVIISGATADVAGEIAAESFRRGLIFN